MIHLVPLLVPCCLFFLFILFVITCTYFNPRTSRSDLSSAAAECNQRPTPMAWNRAYHSHTLPGQSQGQAVTNVSTAISTNSDDDDYEVNNERKTYPVQAKNWTLSSSVHALHQSHELDYVNMIGNQRSLTLPHQNRSATFSGILANDYGCKTLPKYVNIDNVYSWLTNPNVDDECQGAENAPDFNITHSNDNLTVSQGLPTATLPRAAGLASQADGKTHSYQNLPLSPSKSSHVANSEEELADENISKTDESQRVTHLGSFTFHSAFVTSICRALQEEERQAKRDLQAEQDGYVRMQSVSLRLPKTEEVIAIDMELQAEEEERPYYNVIPPPKS